MGNERKRELLAELKSIILSLVEMDKDVATLEVKDNISAVRRVKTHSMKVVNKIKEFRKTIDNIRKEI